MHGQLQLNETRGKNNLMRNACTDAITAVDAGTTTATSPKICFLVQSADMLGAICDIGVHRS
jgi:hypothetical protein